MRTESERERMAERVAEEFLSLELAVQGIEAAERGGFIPLDAFFLHARNLRDFFIAGDSMGDSGEGDLAVAEHFLESPVEWQQARAELPSEWIERTRAALDRELAGLRWGDEADRMRWGEWARAVPDIFRELKRHWETFLWAVDAATTNWLVKAYERHREIRAAGKMPDSEE